MTAIDVTPAFSVFADRTGKAMEGGYIYIGKPNLNPQTNQVAVFWDAALTIPASQPIRTIGGYPDRNGSPGRIFTDAAYSINVRASNGTLVYSAPNQSSGTSPIEFNSITELPTDTTMTYVSDQPGTVTPGQVIATNDGFSMRVEISGFVTPHITTAGGVKMTAVPRNGDVSPKQFGAASAPTNSAAAWQVMANYAVPLGLTIVLDANYQVNSAITHPIGPATGSYSINPTFKIRGNGYTLSTTLESGNLIEVPGFGDFPGRQYHGLVIDGVNFRGPGTSTAAVGFIGLANCRLPVVTRNSFAGSVGGVGVDIWSAASGGSYGAVVEDNHFGYQNAVSLGGSNMRNLATQVYPVALLHGIRARGPGATAGKTNDMMFAKNLFYACVGAAIYQGWHTSYSGDGGSGNIITQANKIVLSQTRDIEEHVLLTSATASTATWPVTATINETSGLYLGFVAKIVSGTGVGQSRQITVDSVSSGVRTITITPNWTVTPDATSEIRITMATPALISEFGVANIPAGIYFDHGYGWKSIADYYEECNAPILGGLNATTSFTVLGPDMKVSDSQWIKKVDGTPFGPRNGDDDGVGMWDAYPTHGVRTGFTLVRSEGTGANAECGSVGTITNNTGGDIIHGDVGRIGTTGPALFVSSILNADRPVVAVSPAERTYANGAVMLYAKSGAMVRVKVTGAVNENDTIVGSATAKTAQVNNSQTDPKKIIGFARSEDVGGYALVEIL